MESQVAAVKLTYAEALKNLEQISDEIHLKRRKSSVFYNQFDYPSITKRISIDSNESLLDDAQELVNSLPRRQHLEDDDTSDDKSTPLVETDVKMKFQGSKSQSNEWIEISLDNSSPEDDIFDKRISNNHKPLSRQQTLPNPCMENEFSSIKSKINLETTISNWISRSSAKAEEKTDQQSRRQSLDNILGPTSEKMKGMFSQGMMLLNIGNTSERRNSAPKLGITETKPKWSIKKIPSPLEKSMYLTADDDNSDSESLCSVDMLNEEQINALMLDKDIDNVCEQLLGTPISEVVQFPQVASSSSCN